MFGVLVLPERLVVPVPVLPEGVHVGEQIGLLVRLEDGGDVGVGARGVARGFVGAVAVLRRGEGERGWRRQPRVERDWRG